MSSTLYNAAALSALQALSMTQQSLNTVQNQVSTGLAVATAADNSSYWSVAAQLNQDDGVVTAANTALTEGQSMLSTASSAISSVITTLNSMATALTEAQAPNANLGAINTSLASLGQQLTDAVNGASFNGLNVLNGSQTAALSFVSGYNATTTGGTVNSISFTAQALYGASGVATNMTTTSTLTDPTAITNIKAVAVTNAAATTATKVSISAPTATFGTDAFYNDTANAAFTIQSMAQDGTVTTSTYTALDSNGNTLAQGGKVGGAALSFANAVSYSVSTTVSGTPGNLLVQGGTDLTTLGSAGGTTVTAGNSGTTLSAVNSALTAITNYAATIGATQDRMTAASTFNAALGTNLQTGISGLVDANMNTASTQLQALQTQEQLGIQSLSIANQNAQLILKLLI